MTTIDVRDADAAPEGDYWRVRMKVGHQFERSEAAWDRSEVGIWYGAWTADDWRRAVAKHPSDPWQLLRDLPGQLALGWDGAVNVSVVRRFEGIGPHEWCMVYLRGRREIGLARLEPGMRSEDDHPLNQDYGDGRMEVFKYRRVSERKTFRVAELPDAYRLLAAQGRAGTVHRLHAMRDQVRLLARQPDEAGVKRALSALSFDDMIHALGPSAWESVCTAYLVIEHGFVPTGLRTGSTLETIDIIGRCLVTVRTYWPSARRTGTASKSRTTFFRSSRRRVRRARPSISPSAAATGMYLAMSPSWDGTRCCAGSRPNGAASTAVFSLADRLRSTKMVRQLADGYGQ